MSVYLWYLGALVVSLIFPPIAIFAFGFAILNHWGINEGKKEKFRKELQQQDWDRMDYEHDKWNDPLSSKTKNKNASLENTIAGAFMPEHDEFLIAQLKTVESSFREHGPSLFRGDNGKISASLDPEKLGGNGEKIAYQLITTPKKYINICHSLDRKPVHELLEVWDQMISQSNQTQESIAKLQNKRKKEEEEFAREIRTMIIHRLSQGENWSVILMDARHQIENSRHSTLRVWREHGDWTIKASRAGSEKQFQLKF